MRGRRQAVTEARGAPVTYSLDWVAGRQSERQYPLVRPEE
jgi:hypothetical protein